VSAPEYVFVLAEEEESGSNANGDTYCVLGVYEDEQDAEAARAEWRSEHEFEPEDWEDPECEECSDEARCATHEQEYLEALESESWCRCHGEGVTIERVQFIRKGSA
jgi:hypothetical protein